MRINEAFGRVIVNLRKNRGQSQEDFAWSIDSDRKYMSDVELCLYCLPIKLQKGLELRCTNCLKR